MICVEENHFMAVHCVQKSDDLCEVAYVISHIMAMYYVIMCVEIVEIVVLYNHQFEMINLSTYSWEVWFCNVEIDDYVQDWLMRTDTFDIIGMKIEEFFDEGGVDHQKALSYLQEETNLMEDSPHGEWKECQCQNFFEI